MQTQLIKSNNKIYKQRVLPRPLLDLERDAKNGKVSQRFALFCIQLWANGPYYQRQAQIMADETMYSAAMAIVGGLQ